jgi:hypothetical protein
LFVGQLVDGHGKSPDKQVRWASQEPSRLGERRQVEELSVTRLATLRRSVVLALSAPVAPLSCRLCKAIVA